MSNDEELTNGVQHGKVMAPTLFSKMFSDTLMDGFPIRYRFDGNTFNLRRLQGKTKVQTDVLHVDELLYADDMDKNAGSEKKCKEPWIKSHSHVI